MKTKTRNDRYVELLDTTLRDGEQTPGVAFTPEEKLSIARLLISHLHLDRLEIGSARVSEGEQEAIRNILAWADHRGCRERMEILGFIDNGKSSQWIHNAGGQVINLLAKGSERHCRVQLKKDPAKHMADVCAEIEKADKLGLTVNVYLEDWSNGMELSFPYVYDFMKVLIEQPVARIMLPDTLGILSPEKVTRYLDWLYAAFPNVRLDFHGHNDYGLVTANSMAAVRAGVSGIHTTINGLGERTGNQPLAQLIVSIHDMTERTTRIAEKEIQHASEMVQALSGKRFSWNMPVVGTDVFTQTCGVHADGDKKGNLYVNRLLPERFGRNRNYALGKLSGKASIDQNLQEAGIEELPSEQREKVLQEIVRLGDRKKQVTPADLPFIIASVLRTPTSGRIQILDYQIESKMNALPKATVKLRIDGSEYCSSASGDGGYDAFVKVLRKQLLKHGIRLPKLADYEVRIPPGGKTDALVETTIVWEMAAGKRLTTTGLDSDQTAAAIVATEKMLNQLIK
ncbi:MAG: 2-isopropylmalate synthase [Lentisphaeria bacterium]|nr:2-isopropylmalate synthase [Lentisphaeria bacterium]